MKATALALFGLFAGVNALAQAPDKLLLIGGTANGFKGELNEFYNRFGPGGHFTLQLNKKKRLNGTFNLEFGGLRMQTNATQVQLPEGSTAKPATFVSTSFAALHYDLHLNLIKTNRWIVYLSQGAGLMRFSAEDANGNNLADNTTTRGSGEEISPVSLVLPTSAGVQHLFKSGYGIGFQAGILNPGTDYLDNMEDLAKTKQSDNVLQYRFSVAIPLSFPDSDAPRVID